MAAIRTSARPWEWICNSAAPCSQHGTRSDQGVGRRVGSIQDSPCRRNSAAVRGSLRPSHHQDRRKKFTNDEIEALRSPNGGFSRSVLARLGTPWPPPRGWKKALMKGQAPASKRNLKT